jgi:hypothetical protein
MRTYKHAADCVNAFPRSALHPPAE